MADNACDLSELGLVKQRHPSAWERDILNAFAIAMRPEPHAAKHAARQINSLCPPLDQREEAGNYIWEVWRMLLDIARSPDVPDEVHSRLINVLQELKQCAKGELSSEGHMKRVWKDLPVLPDCFETYYLDPTWEVAEFTTRSAQMWLKLCTFGARALGAMVLEPYVEVMYGIQSALEQDLTALPLQEMAEWRVKATCAWLTCGAAKRLLWWAKENEGYSNVEDEGSYIQQGPLYEGPAVMCFERWQFWMDRLQQLAKEGSGLSEETRQTALETVQIMKEVHESLLKIWSES